MQQGQIRMIIELGREDGLDEEVILKRLSSKIGLSPEEARETAKVVGLSAIKYGDLSNQASKDYIFDVDRFTSFEGNTGPYGKQMM